MVSEHMLTVGRDPRNWQAHRKDFLYKLHFQRIFYLSSLLSLFKYSLRLYPFPFFTTRIRVMRPLQEGQDIGQPRPLRNEGDSTVHLNNGNYNSWGLRRLGEFEGSEEFPDFYDLGRLPLWNLTDYGSCQCPRSGCIRERPEHGELKT